MEQRLETLSCGMLRRARILFLFLITYDSRIATGKSVWTPFVTVIGYVGTGLRQYKRADGSLLFRPSACLCVSRPNLSRIARILKKVKTFNNHDIAILLINTVKLFYYEENEEKL